MTSAEIITYFNQAREQSRYDMGPPLWEIALQLAILNERDAAADNESVNRMLRKVGLGGLTIGEAADVAAVVANSTGAHNQYVIAIQQPFPFVHSDGVRGGRQWWGVWYGPGPSARSFPTREAAEKCLEENPPPPAMAPSTLPPPIAPWIDRRPPGPAPRKKPRRK